MQRMPRADPFRAASGHIHVLPSPKVAQWRTPPPAPRLRFVSEAQLYVERHTATPCGRRQVSAAKRTETCKSCSTLRSWRGAAALLVRRLAARALARTCNELRAAGPVAQHPATLANLLAQLIRTRVVACRPRPLALLK